MMEGKSAGLRLVCVSASNIAASGDGSTSLKIARLVEKRCRERDDVSSFSLIDLRRHTLTPCEGCGGCFHDHGRCRHDDGYNKLSDTVTAAGALFIVSPHYAPIPAKLAMFLEKIEQYAFLKKFNDDSYRSPLSGKPLGIIAHGGGTRDLAEWYRGVVVEPIANALASFPVWMKQARGEEGLIVPVARVTKSASSIFPVQEYDWQAIEKEVGIYVDAVLAGAAVSPTGG